MRLKAIYYSSGVNAVACHVERCRPNVQTAGIEDWNLVTCKNCLRIRDDEDAFWSRTDRNGECWAWTGSYDKASGYGVLTVGKRQTLAHRIAYQLAHGLIASQMQIDHVCHNRDKNCPGGSACRHRRCVNPSHLELATNKENVLRGKGLTATNARKTHCDYGHIFDTANTRITKKGGRHCRACSRRRWHEIEKHKYAQ